jgi:hypothetical protein
MRANFTENKEHYKRYYTLSDTIILCPTQMIAQNDGISVLGAVYTCDSAYKLPYDSLYDFLHIVVCNLIVNRFFLKYLDKQL